MGILGIYASANYPRVTNSYESISTVTVGSGGAASISFSSIPSTYKQLQVRGIGRTTSSSNPIFIQLNSDTTTSNYYSHALYGNGSAAYAQAEGSTYSQYVNYFPISTDTASAFGAVVIDVLDYQNTNKYKTVRALGGFDKNGGGFAWFNSTLWKNTNAITNITIQPYSGNLAEYSSFALYGIKG